MNENNVARAQQTVQELFQALRRHIEETEETVAVFSAVQALAYVTAILFKTAPRTYWDLLLQQFTADVRQYMQESLTN